MNTGNSIKLIWNTTQLLNELSFITNYFLFIVDYTTSIVLKSYIKNVDNYTRIISQ